MAANNGVAVPVINDGNGAHFRNEVMSDGRRVTMAREGNGTARGFTTLDYAALDDIGWELPLPFTFIFSGQPPQLLPPNTTGVTVFLRITPPQREIDKHPTKAFSWPLPPQPTATTMGTERWHPIITAELGESGRRRKTGRPRSCPDDDFNPLLFHVGWALWGSGPF